MAIDCRFSLSTTEEWEPSTLALKLKTILKDLRKKMKECIQYIGKPVLCIAIKMDTWTWHTCEIKQCFIIYYIRYHHVYAETLLFNAEEMRDIESHQRLADLFNITQIDNMKALKALICPRDDVQALVDGTTKKRVGNLLTHIIIITEAKLPK